MKRLLILSLISVSACTWTPEGRYFKTAEKAYREQKWPEAAEYYEKTVKTAPESEEAVKASEAGIQVAQTHTKNPQQLVIFLKHLILYSKSQQQRVESQKLLAETYFEKLNDYKNSVVELNRALEIYKVGKEAATLRLMLARSYFFLNQFFQAQTEVESALRTYSEDRDFTFKGQLLKANIFFNEKRLDEAITLYQKLLSEFPQRAKEEQVALNLAACYEEKEDFTSAIDVLEKLKTTNSNNTDNSTIPDIITMRIAKLKARLEQQPGAKGLKK